MADRPVARPLFADALVNQIHAANEEAGSREQAFATSFRASDAGGCARKLAYSMLGYPQTNPADLAGEWVMWLGTLIGEKLGEALQHRYGSRCELEVKVRHGDLVSGHIDAYLKDPELGKVVVEFKTKGGYGFDKAIGINRKAYSTMEPEGPPAANKIQGALYAAALDADLLVIGVIGLESISKQLAARVGWDELARFSAEWHYDKAEYGPWARAELSRMEMIDETVKAGYLPNRVAIGDQHQAISLRPDSDRQPWQCAYCGHRSRCIADGDGAIPIKKA